ncbi:MAG: redoxin domain-containing protein [Bradyrhizobium sp.]
MPLVFVRYSRKNNSLEPSFLRRVAHLGFGFAQPVPSRAACAGSASQRVRGGQESLGVREPNSKTKEFDMTEKLPAGSETPKISVPRVGGGQLSIGGGNRWQMLVVYRGKHCPICRSYLKTLDGLLDQFEETGTEVFAASADTKEKAETEASEEGWRFPVGYGLSQDQMRTLGLYISEPRSPQETDRPFPEPGLFVTNPEGKLQIVDVSNAPFARPELNAVLKGIKLIREKQYPIRGTLG